MASIASALGLRPVTVAGYVAALERKASEQGAQSLEAFVARYGPLAERPAVPRGALTPRQQEVLGLLRDGMLPEQIAERLQVQSATLRRHFASIQPVIGGDELDTLLAEATAKQEASRAAARKAAEKAAKKKAAAKKKKKKAAAAEKLPADDIQRDRLQTKARRRASARLSCEQACPRRSGCSWTCDEKLRRPEARPTTPNRSPRGRS